MAVERPEPSITSSRASSPTGGARDAIGVRGLQLGFGTTTVLDNIDLTIAEGSAVALIGANGAGKSTLLRSLIRLVEPRQGKVRIFDREVTALKGRDLVRLRAEVGMVFQRHNLVPRLSALSNVVHGVQSRARGFRTWSQLFATEAVRSEALDCLNAVGLADKARQRADSLSGGQSQRVAVARMLMQRPRIVLADEPDASLDPRSGDEVMRTLHGLAKDKGLTLVFVSHRMEHALRYSDRIVGLAAGGIALDSPSKSCEPDALRAFFGGEETPA
ncbi:MAG: ATP-binding cassette domain-containing protein [Hyphomicrobiales bacterium]|nr:ATP-binding cassette domain-containing protein [Hyphomicrobiales bacterium]